MSEIKNERDMAELLRATRRDLQSIRATHFDLHPVTELSAIKGISFAIEQEAYLKEIGALSQCPKWDYGYFRSNENNAKVNNALTAADKLIVKILDCLDQYRIRPRHHFTETEKAFFEVIEGKGHGSWIATKLKGGLI